MSDTTKRIAVLGAGPIGIEAALYARRLGHDVQVYERDRPGAHIEEWSHVTFFSPWSLDRSAWGEELLEARGVELAPADEFPTGRRYLDDYLAHLLDDPLLEGRVHAGAEVVRVSRRGALKGEAIGSRGELGAFLLLLRDDEETERLVEADVVIDATGVYANPLHLGPGGLPALGEWECEAYIERHIPDPLGADREIYEGARTLVVGHGHSAVTSLRQLHGLRTHDEGTEIHWVYRADEEPYRVADDDPLPQRATLDAFGNRAAAGDIDGITPHPGRVVESLDCTARGDILCGLRDAEGNIDDIFVDRVVANVGYRPDTEMTRELQVHYCYASEGIMNLAASLLAEGGGSGDCLDQRSPGPEVLTNPETDFFVLGAKSYGRNSDFLLRVGFEQIEQIFEIIEG